MSRRPCARSGCPGFQPMGSEFCELIECQRIREAVLSRGRSSRAFRVGRDVPAVPSRDETWSARAGLQSEQVNLQPERIDCAPVLVPHKEIPMPTEPQAVTPKQRRAAILEHLRAGSSSAAELAEQLKLEPGNVSYDLVVLVKAGQIRKEGGGPATRYALADGKPAPVDAPAGTPIEALDKATLLGRLVEAQKVIDEVKAEIARRAAAARAEAAEWDAVA